ncbi:Hypothetical protein GbCGDNIH1_1702 [Granulibacter bethesdensis CGDNIH1]|uniref:Uncharacterized protein n=1 Tax=Granulibacter bethesdensis (strain ATCC BAA-1260 / CGDNIH1) TaxID=391165 RepID=Q0BRF2_GRABC|nr:Hypothetical protein GbCGDNIH1_1702 [Granulibacter bethesdensis CGDNIH1]APH52454.1 Hypothetical protein GbCGDNIH5_1702 [Granulibacter bethesdensis]APH65143.1 Hypothetical protein GbCGDNIH1I4_1702 [Granulibacter bethesdensis]
MQKWQKSGGTGVYLRARGGTALPKLRTDFDKGLSPRTRRNPIQNSTGTGAVRSISAHAEEPEGLHRCIILHGVYLRARGGTGPISGGH